MFGTLFCPKMYQLPELDRQHNISAALFVESKSQPKRSPFISLTLLCDVFQTYIAIAAHSGDNTHPTHL